MFSNLLKFCSVILSLHFQIVFSSSFDLLFNQLCISVVFSINSVCACSEPSEVVRRDFSNREIAIHAMIWERPLEKSFCHDLQHRIMIHPYDTVQPTGMGMVEIPAELAEAVWLLVKLSNNDFARKNHLNRAFLFIIWYTDRQDIEISLSGLWKGGLWLP